MVYNEQRIREDDISFFLFCFKEVLLKWISSTVATPLEGFL